jgi:gluconolactonase
MMFTDGLSVPEAPVLMRNGDWLVVEMGADRGAVTRVSADGTRKTIIARTGRPNGLAVDRAGYIWVAESLDPTLLRLGPDGSARVIARGCDGEPFLFPNDLAFAADGTLYMTDSGIRFEDFVPGGQIRPDWREAPTDGRVYRIDPRTNVVQKLDSGLRFANGIAFGPDGQLYVAETLTGDIQRYRVGADGTLGPRRIFGNVLDPQGPTGVRGPDGMKFDAAGFLYVTVFGQAQVCVLGPDGQVDRRLRTEGDLPTNLAFGPPDGGRIYVTEDRLGRIEMFDVPRPGLALFD